MIFIRRIVDENLSCDVYCLFTRDVKRGQTLEADIEAKAKFKEAEEVRQQCINRIFNLVIR